MDRTPASARPSHRPSGAVLLWARRPAAAIAAGGLVAALAAPAVLGQDESEITSDGPLTRIIVTRDLNCQVSHEADLSFEFFGLEAGACGTFLSIGEALFSPADVPPAGLIGTDSWTSVDQSAIRGSGSGGDPLTLVTTVDAGATGIRLEQTDSYVTGEESYRTDIRISNTTGTDERAILYRAGDCFLQDSDTGFGRVDEDAPACVIAQSADARIEQWVPITPGSRYYEGSFLELWQRVESQQPFPNGCQCDTAIDNGAGLSWEIVIPARGEVEVSHLTFFSPEGRQATTPLRDSVPGPADISLDPLVIASSAVIAAGIVVLMPFPATLFNSTLEEHYAEVMAAMGRFRGWLRRLFSRGLARGRQALTDARSRRAPPTGEPTTGPPQATAQAPSRLAFLGDEAFWRSPLGIGVFILASALLYGLLDPTFGFDASSLATFLGLALGMAIMLLAFGIPLLIGARLRGVGLSARALPATLLIAVLCVLISRIAEFQPGYLYGLIIGFTFSRALSKPEAGKLDAVAAGCGLVVAIAAWLLLPVVRGGEASESPPFVTALLETAFTTVVVAGLEAAAIAMIPVRFMPGERVRSWNRWVWAALLGLAALGFCHILINPTSGYLADTTRTSLFTVVWLLVAFGAASVLFWAYFRFRRQPDAASSPKPPLPSSEPPTPT